MQYVVQHTRNEEKDRRKSALITFLISLLVFLGIFFYKFTKITEKPEEVTMMLINFGDNQNGSQTEEPMNQEGSLAAEQTADTEQPVQEKQTEQQQQQKASPIKPVVKEKIITGSNTKVSAPKVEKSQPKKTTVPKTSASKKTSASAPKKTVANSKTGTGDGKGTAAVGNLLKGRGTKPGSQRTNGTTGNAGDPLGGDGNGDSKIGVDRKLIAFIPGTMGRGGSQPSHNCSASGTINISYTVDKAGNVTSARRSGGISDPCAVSATVSWVKKYVKAEKASTSSTGNYRITF